MSVKAYFVDAYRMMRSIAVGMGITIRYFPRYKKHTCTIQYPRERDAIPPRHRGIHYLETEKCVMCWKCSEICPVSCIYIEGVRGADGPLRGGYRGQKATLSKFTVDYSVCIFCGLCEEPCPPKCIYLGPAFNFNATDRTMMEKNLLTDEVYTDEDEKYVQWARGEAERLKEEKKRKAEEEKLKAAAAKAAGAQAAAAAAAAQASAGSAKASETRTPSKAGGAPKPPGPGEPPSAPGPNGARESSPTEEGRS